MSTLDDQLHEYFTALHRDDAAAPGRADYVAGPVVDVRGRRVLWATLAAAVLVVLGVGMILLAGGSDRSDRYVEDRRMEPAPAQPMWLGPSDPGEVGGVELHTSRWWSQPGSDPPDPEGWRTSSAFTLFQHDVMVTVDRAELDGIPGTWSETTIAGRPAVVGVTTPEGDVTAQPMLRADLGDGWLLIVSDVGGAPVTEEIMERLVRVAEDLEVREPSYWLPIIDEGMRNGGSSPRPGYKLGLTGSDGTAYVQAIGGTEATKALVVPDLPVNAHQLVSMLAISGTPSELPAGQPIEVRGAEGVVARAEDVRGEPGRVLAWFEGGFQHRLYGPPDAGADVLVGLADRLVALPEVDWERAVFPVAIPSGLADRGWQP